MEIARVLVSLHPVKVLPVVTALAAGLQLPLTLRDCYIDRFLIPSQPTLCLAVTKWTEDRRQTLCPQGRYATAVTSFHGTKNLSTASSIIRDAGLFRDCDGSNGGLPIKNMEGWYHSRLLQDALGYANPQDLDGKQFHLVFKVRVMCSKKCGNKRTWSFTHSNCERYFTYALLLVPANTKKTLELMSQKKKNDEPSSQEPPGAPQIGPDHQKAEAGC